MARVPRMRRHVVMARRACPSEASWRRGPQSVVSSGFIPVSLRPWFARSFVRFRAKSIFMRQNSGGPTARRVVFRENRAGQATIFGRILSAARGEARGQRLESSVFLSEYCTAEGELFCRTPPAVETPDAGRSSLRISPGKCEGCAAGGYYPLGRGSIPRRNRTIRAYFWPVRGHRVRLSTWRQPGGIRKKLKELENNLEDFLNRSSIECAENSYRAPARRRRPIRRAFARRRCKVSRVA
jgi:hypothetical protein